MDDHVYKLIELTGSSAQSMEAAVENAVERAAQKVHNLHWFEVTDVRGHIVEGKVRHWQVSLKIGFTLDD